MRNERETRTDLIDPALDRAGWDWVPELLIGPGRVNQSGPSMYDEAQEIRADYVLRIDGVTVAALEAKAESADAIDGIQQAERYARRLGVRFALASNGHRFVVLDTETGEFNEVDAPPAPETLLADAGRAPLPEDWRRVLEVAPYVDQISHKKLRAYQRRAIEETVARFAHGDRRVLLLMATGTGKTFTVFQLVWMLIKAGVLERDRVLFLTDRNSLQGQAYRAFAAYPEADRVVIDKATVAKHEHLVGKVFYANYQTLYEEVKGKKLFEHYDPDFFDLVVVDECHRSGFGDWFGVLEHFGSAYQVGLTATPRELGEPEALTEAEARRDTFAYFTGDSEGEPAFTYSLKRAIDDGYLVPYILDQRTTNLDRDGHIGEDGATYTTPHFERTIRLPDRTRSIAEDLYASLRKKNREHEKTVVFCVDDTHAAFMAAELRRLAGDAQYAARITRSERNSHQLERNFAEVGDRNPRIACTVDLLTTGFDAPDVQHVVFARPVKSALLYKQMKGRGTRLCEDIDKRSFTIVDYAGATRLEDAEFDGHPLNQSEVPKKRTTPATPSTPPTRLIETGVHVEFVDRQQFICFADGRKIPLDEYREQARDVIQSLPEFALGDLYDAWPDRQRRQALRGLLRDHDVHVSAFKGYYDLEDADDADVIAKVGFDLVRIPMRRDRVARIWTDETPWLESLIGDDQHEQKLAFWETALDHYALFGIDDLEKGQTYSAPHFAARFGPFPSLVRMYGGPERLREHLEEVKRHLYTPLATN